MGYKTDPENLQQTAHNLSGMTGYILMNKIIFHKILEQTYRLLPMRWLNSSSSVNFKKDLNRCVQRAIDVADFEPIFDTGVYDRLPMPDDPELLEYVNAFIDTIDSVEVGKLGEQIGYMYEELIPPQERHQLGQFYTPPWVCELITKWCIKSGDDIRF